MLGTNVEPPPVPAEAPMLADPQSEGHPDTIAQALGRYNQESLSEKNSQLEIRGDHSRYPDEHGHS